MKSFEKFKEKLPSKEKFYSSLTGKEIIDKDYKHTPKSWNAFKMKTMKYYQDLYLKCDISLLVHIVEKFKNNSFKKL